jgi:hypothetical protein
MKNISALDRAGMNLCKLFLVETTLNIFRYSTKVCVSNLTQMIIYKYVLSTYLYIHGIFESHVFVTKSTTITVSM